MPNFFDMQHWADTSPDMFQQPQDNETNLFRLFNRFTPKNDAMSAYQQHLDAMPTRDQYAPSKLRRILAGASGFGVGWRNPEAGMKLTESIIDQPFNRATDDWKQKGSVLGAKAEAEQSYNQNEAARMKSLLDYWGKDAETQRKTKLDELNILKTGAEIKQIETNIKRGKLIKVGPSNKTGNMMYRDRDTNEIVEVPMNYNLQEETKIKSEPTLTGIKMREQGANSRNAASNATSVRIAELGQTGANTRNATDNMFKHLFGGDSNDRSVQRPTSYTDLTAGDNLAIKRLLMIEPKFKNAFEDGRFNLEGDEATLFLSQLNMVRQSMNLPPIGFNQAIGQARQQTTSSGKFVGGRVQ